VLAAILLVAIVAFVAFTIDIGGMALVRTELQNAAGRGLRVPRPVGAPGRDGR
jgi:hypothetical protein